MQRSFTGKEDEWQREKKLKKRRDKCMISTEIIIIIERQKGGKKETEDDHLIMRLSLLHSIQVTHHPLRLDTKNCFVHKSPIELQ